MTRVPGLFSQTSGQPCKLFRGEIFRTNPPIHTSIFQPSIDIICPQRLEDGSELLAAFLKQEMDGPCQFFAIDRDKGTLVKPYH